MIKNIIFDFMGIVADINYKKMLKNLSLHEKIKALRLFVKYKTSSELQNAFEDYKTGYINLDDVDCLITKHLPSYRGLIKKLSMLAIDNININSQVLKLIESLKQDGFNVLLMSNSTPETETVMANSCLDKLFDGIILSTKLGIQKPDPLIFNFAKETYGFEPFETYFIDDSIKNIDSAQNLGFKTLYCKNTNDALQKTSHLFYSNYMINDDQCVEK